MTLSPPFYVAFLNQPQICGDIGDENHGPPLDSHMASSYIAFPNQPPVSGDIGDENPRPPLDSHVASDMG